ncbi:MAG: hypothetical protein RSC68_34195, partial [Acinetobacter sp.]
TRGLCRLSTCRWLGKCKHTSDSNQSLVCFLFTFPAVHAAFGGLLRSLLCMRLWADCYVPCCARGFWRIATFPAVRAAFGGLLRTPVGTPYMVSAQLALAHSFPQAQEPCYAGFHRATGRASLPLAS